MRALLVVAVAGVFSMALAGAAHAQQSVPAAPTDLIAGPYPGSPTETALFWHDNAGNEDAYRVERSGDGENGPWTLVTQTANECPLPGERQCAYVDRNLAPETTYWYRVAAVNAAGVSAYSNVASAETAALPTPEPGTIHGHVFNDHNGNGALDKGDSGVSGMQLDLLQRGQHLQTAGTGSSGEYIFGGLPAGHYTVVADLHQRYAPSCSTTAFSFNPLQRGACLTPVFPWDPATPDSVDVMVDGGVTLDFGARPADVAVWVGDAILELDHPPAGTEIVALVNGKECGTATVAGGSAYDFMIDVLGAGERPDCARPGDIVQFTVGGVPAAEAAGWASFSDPSNPAQLAFHNLVAMQQHAWYWFQVSGSDLPAAGTLVQAVIDGMVCGEARVEAPPGVGVAGFSKLIVPSADLQPGCGRAGAMVSFRFNGVAIGEPIEWRTGLQYISPLVGPVVLPGTGGGSSRSDANVWLAALVAVALGGSLLLGAGRLRSRRNR